MRSLLFFVLAAGLEIAGCYAFWTWLRAGRSAWVSLLGVISLIGFAICLTRVDAAYAGRAFAAYGGVYIASSILWLWGAERITPDRWDLVGAAICIGGALVVLLGPRPEPS
jgi:small multidrug resistance family-3 protein